MYDFGFGVSILVRYTKLGRFFDQNFLGNVQCVQGAYGEPAFEELDEIFYIVKPNKIF